MPIEQPGMPKRRWFHATPGRLLVVLLVVEGSLLLSERWFPKGWPVLIAIASVGMMMVLLLFWFVLALLFRWRFQFSIRSLLLLTVAVAIPCSWLAVDVQQATKQKEAVEALKKMDVTVGYSEVSDSFGYLRGDRPGPAWVRKLVGDAFFLSPGLLFFGKDRATIDLERLTVLDQVSVVCFDRNQVTDVEGEYLLRLNKLHDLFLTNAEITDAAWEKTGSLKQLRKLVLYNVTATNTSLQCLGKIQQLEHIAFYNVPLTDADLEKLAGMDHLRTLELLNTQVTTAGIARLQETLPTLTIQR